MSNKPQCAPAEAWEAPIVALLRAEESKQPLKDGADRSAPADVGFFQIVQNLPVAVYSTDAAGRITFYNDAAASLWGRHPKLGARLVVRLVASVLAGRNADGTR